MELGQLVLKRFLLLALLLDRAVAGPKPCPKGAPLLFRRGQPTKSSAQVPTLSPSPSFLCSLQDAIHSSEQNVFEIGGTSVHWPQNPSHQQVASEKNWCAKMI